MARPGSQIARESGGQHGVSDGEHSNKSQNSGDQAVNPFPHSQSSVYREAHANRAALWVTLQIKR